MKRAVVTGATGMLGATLTHKLVSEGVEVLAVARPNSSKIRNVLQHDLVTLVECSLANLSRLDENQKKSYDVFYHFAWDGTFGNSRNDVYTQNLNTKYTLDAVALAAKLGCSAFIGAGSQAEYGRVEGRISANTPTNPENGYGIEKYTAGKLSKIYADQLGLRHSWVRILSTYGPMDSGFTMIMSTIYALLKKEIPPLTKGEQQWDYLFSEDCANAFYLVGEHGKHGAVYPLGSGVTRPLHDFVCELRDAINPKLSLGFGEIPYGDKQVMNLSADISQLAKDTGFTPQVPFGEGIKKTIKWCMANMHGESK